MDAPLDPQRLKSVGAWDLSDAVSKHRKVSLRVVSGCAQPLPQKPLLAALGAAPGPPVDSSE